MSSSSFCFQPLRRAGLCALLLHRVVEWRAVTRSRSPSSTKNPPVPDTPRVAHAEPEIGRPTVVAGRSLHLGLDHRVMGVSKGGGDGCCGDGGLSTKRDTTEARISTSDAARLEQRIASLDDDGALLRGKRLGPNADPQDDRRLRRW